jgi:hypothetical protein
LGGGIRYKYFNKKFDRTFTANTENDFSLSDFGLDGITPKGFAMQVIAGSSNYDSAGALFYNTVSKKIKYICKASNSSYCEFKGIVFY